MIINQLQILGSKEVCRRLKISEQYLKYLLFRKKIAARKISSVWIFALGDIIEFQKMREKKAKTDKRVRVRK